MASAAGRPPFYTQELSRSRIRLPQGSRDGMPIAITSTPLEGVVIIDPKVMEDERGFFMESWNARDFREAGIADQFVQDSHSRSTRGVVRGLHYQDITAPLSKLVRCTVGRVFDVVVDLRLGSPTFGKWFSVELSADDRRQLYIPVGFAHGFQTLSEVAEVQYKQTGFYAPGASRVLAWDDPDVGIAWPLADHLLSDRDMNGMTLRDYAAQPAFTYRQAG
jgi:dTDP-4-dehydrorhamnose 3,5-epimerase